MVRSGQVISKLVKNQTYTLLQSFSEYAIEILIIELKMTESLLCYSIVHIKPEMPNSVIIIIKQRR